MRSLVRLAAPGRAAPHCMIWLPGAYQSPEDFLSAGFDTLVRERALPLDLEFVDLEPAHLTDRAALERLASAALTPARARGSAVWLGGISLGGFMALDFASAHPGDWDGLCLLAPFLGPRGLLATPLAQSDEERRIWDFIGARSADTRPCFLGFGREDRYAAAHVLMAEALPADSVRIVPGGHDWPTWRRLWELFLDARFA